MGLPNSGEISLLDVTEELTGLRTESTISLGNTPVRSLAGIPSGTISLSDLHGKVRVVTVSVDLQPLTLKGPWQLGINIGVDGTILINDMQANKAVASGFWHYSDAVPNKEYEWKWLTPHSANADYGNPEDNWEYIVGNDKSNLTQISAYGSYTSLYFHVREKANHSNTDWDVISLDNASLGDQIGGPGDPDEPITE